MPSTVEKPGDRSVEELLEGLKQSLKQAKDGKGSSRVEQLRKQIQNKREH
jgi:hypothetical protein